MTTSYACPVCGKKTEVAEGEKVVHCPYCNTDFLTMEGEERYVMPSYYNSSSCFETFMLWAKKQGGYDESTPIQLHMDSATLNFYPFWVISLEGTTTFTGLGEDAEYSWPDGGAYRQMRTFLRPEQGTFERRFELLFPAAKDFPQELRSYQIPGRARKYFTTQTVTEAGGTLHGGVLGREAAEQMANDAAKQQFSLLIDREVDRVDTRKDALNLVESYYIYVPIWTFGYSFKGKGYDAFVDASTGRVIFATYPPSIKERASYMGVALLSIVAGGIVAGLLYLEGAPMAYLVPLPLGLVGAGVAYAYRSLQPTRGGEKLEE
jgi:DNA-directed RNA polymerase subunit RPC12/RpoP